MNETPEMPQLLQTVTESSSTHQRTISDASDASSAETASASSLRTVLQADDPSVSEFTSSAVKRPAAVAMDVDEIPDKRQKLLALPNLSDPIWRTHASRASSPANSAYSESHESSTGKGGGARPATFLYTLCHFLDNNAESPFMRWAADGSYFLILDKDGLMREVIPQLFSQNSYSSFARQLNIYGWRRLQTSPDGKTTNAHCTIWKHDDIYRNCPDDRIKNVKRNATDKNRRSSKTSQDPDEIRAAERARSSVVSTTIAQALASRPRSESAPDRQRIASLTIKGPRYPQPAIFHEDASTRPVRNLPARSAISGNMLATTTSQLSLRGVAHRQERSEAEPTAGPVSLQAAPAPVLRDARRPAATGHGRMSSIETASDYATPTLQAEYQVLQAMPTAQPSASPSNPVDIFVACLKHEMAPPAIVARDRLDIPVWIDPLANLRFVLVGDIMRSWVVWDIFPSKTLLFVMSADAKVPPRPLGSPKALRSNGANGDPKVAVSRERIYLEAPAEPGSVGQCCLVFRSSAVSMQSPIAARAESHYGETSVHHAQQAAVFAYANGIRQKLFASAQSPIFPATPLQSGPPPISAERRGPATAVPGRDVASSLPTDLLSGSAASSEPEPPTPHTADAISSLTLMQALSRKSAIGIPDFDDEGFAEQPESGAAYRSRKADSEGSLLRGGHIAETNKINEHQSTSMDELAPSDEMMGIAA